MNESMPSSAQPAHAAQKPRTWFVVSGVARGRVVIVMLGQYTKVRVLLAPHGTRGDVQPMLALAAGLRDRGHAAAFCAPSNFLSWIGACGFEASSNGVDMEA